MAVYDENCADDEVRISADFLNNNYDLSSTSGACAKSLYKVLRMEYKIPEGDENANESWVEDSLSMIGFSHNSEGIRETRHSLIKIDENVHASGCMVLEVGKALFDRIYSTDKSYEMAVFIKEDVDVEKLKNILETQGFQLTKHKTVYEIYNRRYDTWSIINDGNEVTKENYREYLEEN